MAEEQNSLTKIQTHKKIYRHYDAYQKNKEESAHKSPKKSENILVGRVINFEKLQRGLKKKYAEGKLDLEDLQQESILKITNAENRDYSFASGYFHACTGFGKTYLMIAMAEGYRAEEKDKKIVIFEENQSVLEQVKKDFIEKTSFNADDIGVFYAKEKDVDKPIVICTYASMKKVIEEIGKANIGLVLCDEAHHVLSDNRKSIANELSKACLYGFTATPNYDEDKNCARVFGQLIDSVTIEEGVRSGLLCGVKNGLLVSKVEVDLSKVHRKSSSNNEYDADELLDAIEKASPKKGIREALADFYMSGYDESIGFIRGKQTIINTPSKKEADALVRMFNKKAGKVIAQAYHSDTSNEPLQDFNEGKFPVLVQVNRISEGYNNPKVEICINYPTASRVRETQCGGRTLRYDKDNPLKLALVLDITFMQDIEGNVYDEAAKNGQVLFKDVAGAYYITSEEYERKNVNEGTLRVNKRTIDDTMSYYSQPENKLFNVRLNCKELYMINWGYENLVKERKNLREIKDTDITKDQFVNYSLEFKVRYNAESSYGRYGSRVREKQKRIIWNALQATGYNIITEVKDGNITRSVLPRENMKQFQVWLRDNGFDLIRDELETDISMEDFLKHKISVVKKGQVPEAFEIRKMWQDLKEQNFLQTVPEKYEGFVLKSSGFTRGFLWRDKDVIPAENFPAVKEWFKTQDIEIVKCRDFLPKSDLTMEDMDIKNWRFIKEGIWFSFEEEELWNNLAKQPNMLDRVRTESDEGPVSVFYVLPKKNRNKFIEFFTKRGFEVIPPKKFAVRGFDIGGKSGRD